MLTDRFTRLSFEAGRNHGRDFVLRIEFGDYRVGRFVGLTRNEGATCRLIHHGVSYFCAEQGIAHLVKRFHVTNQPLKLNKLEDGVLDEQVWKRRFFVDTKRTKVGDVLHILFISSYLSKMFKSYHIIQNYKKNNKSKVLKEPNFDHD